MLITFMKKVLHISNIGVSLYQQKQITMTTQIGISYKRDGKISGQPLDADLNKENSKVFIQGLTCEKPSWYTIKADKKGDYILVYGQRVSIWFI